MVIAGDFVVVVKACASPMVIAGDLVVVVMGCAPPMVIAGDFVVAVALMRALAVVVRGLAVAMM